MEIDPNDYETRCNVISTLWMDNILTDKRYYSIRDKLDKFEAERRVMSITNEMNHTSYIEAMDNYIENLKRKRETNPETAKKEAIISLIESGLFKEDGTPKTQICDLCR